MPSDLELLDRWRDDDLEAGNQLFKRHFASLCQFFENKLDDDDVGELVQRTFLACVRSRDSFRGQSSFRTYMFAIARNELYAFFRRRRTIRDKFDFDHDSVADLGTSPSAALARDQHHALLLQALRSVPVEQQLLLELYYWEELDAGELAEVFGIERATARTRLHRARALLKAEFERLSRAAGVDREFDLASAKAVLRPAVQR
ncbi:MAG TPA: sigma-70 family RNA polymerase sigma factor [Enhygromyxa sp.]|nr:sigma-70 family RNA polymerase sigma factor [Enhygromyxa sp.]